MILPHLITFQVLCLIGLIGAKVLLDDDEEYTKDCMQFVSIDNLPDDPPDSEHSWENFHIGFLTVYKNDKKTCSYQIVTLNYLNPAKEKINLSTLRTNCKVNTEDYPLEKVIKVVDKDSVLIQLENSLCSKMTVVWDEEEKKPVYKDACLNKCQGLEKLECPASAVEVEASYDDEVKVLFGEISDQMWNKEKMRSKIKMRLVSKSWNPTDGTAQDYKMLDVYKGSTEEAFKILNTAPTYKYVEALMGENNAQALFTMKNAEGVVEYKKDRPSIMIIHPLSGHGSVNFVKTTVTALAMRNIHRHYNIFVVDMPELNTNMLSSILRNLLGEDPMYRVFTELIGEFFKEAIQSQLIKASDINLIGYSFSGQLAGYLARYITELTNEKITSIIALDPTGSRENPYVNDISASDAKVVHIYHSNSFPCGTMERIGTADFTFNNGFLQKECASNPIPFLCSHKHIVIRWWYVVLYGPTLFKARECSTILQFNAGLCDNNPTAYMTYPIVNNPAKGNYYIRTLNTKPYGMGDLGSVCDPAMKQKIQTSLQEQKTAGKNPYDLQLFLSLMAI